MKIRKGLAATFGAALLAAGAGATAHAIADGNTTGSATNTPSGHGGTVSPSQSPDFGNVTAGANASGGSLIARSGQGNTRSDQKAKAKSGSSKGSAKGSAKSGSIKIHF
ncbi:MAG: hypothetical protein JO176_12130 [Acidimicrobiia bacterium]|nr:hypothetical protein [Acidimicrobiia bacterium]